MCYNGKMNSLRILHLKDLYSYLKQFPVIARFFAEKLTTK
ncbi:hypothetical protein C426_0849 [Lactococcus garvieae DCC43]|uniref:Uncharacterized protein n=1 Tax=Lactococcus garvieae DCC43 TaxID=1231377 RepID=K2PK36_9LACT|nr:hypothetical protein C426_0849 [Lactococcus garvieae DCC43]